MVIVDNLKEEYMKLSQQCNEEKKILERFITSPRCADSRDENRRQNAMNTIERLTVQLDVLTKQLREHAHAEEKRKRVEDECKRVEEEHKCAEEERKRTELNIAHYVAMQQRADAEQKALAEKKAQEQKEWDALTYEQQCAYNEHVRAWNARIDEKNEALRVAFVCAMFGHDTGP